MSQCFRVCVCVGIRCKSTPLSPSGVFTGFPLLENKLFGAAAAAGSLMRASVLVSRTDDFLSAARQPLPHPAAGLLCCRGRQDPYRPSRPQ